MSDTIAAKAHCGTVSVGWHNMPGLSDRSDCPTIEVMADKLTGEVIIKTDSADDLRLLPLEAMRLAQILHVAADLGTELAAP